MGAVRQAFAQNLAHHRERLGLTQAKLAERIDTSPSYVGHLERGEREPSLLTIEVLSTALGIHAGEFFVIRDRSDAKMATQNELDELLRPRSADDVAMAIRLVRAALEHPSFRGRTDSGGHAADEAKKTIGRPAARSTPRLAKKSLR